MRRDELQPAARLALFREFADYFRSLVPYPIEVSEQLSNEQYVRNAIDVLFQRTVLENHAFRKEFKAFLLKGRVGGSPPRPAPMRVE
jgi:hypothetical protein